jgi:5-methylcytosine-specific restriction endonuclease McrA
MGTHSGLVQRTLFCPCGAALPAVAGRCRRCYQHSVDSRRRFGGRREAVLARDRGCCVVCGIRPVRPHVHHRRPGIHDRRWLATVCPRCHTRIHKLASLARGWMPPRLIELWAEQHPHTPLQLQFAWESPT